MSLIICDLAAIFAFVHNGIAADAATPRPHPTPRYGIPTFTRKKRLASFVGPQDWSTRLVFPSTV